MEESRSLEAGEVRIKHSLNKKEEEFVVKRREAVFQSLQKLKPHCSQDEVPNIALLASGGGQRAMVGLLESLVEFDKAGLLDCILYLSGVSGSTWCMASLDQEPDWSTKLDTVKDKIIKGPRVSLTDALAKLKKYYYEKDIFSLTDVWAVMPITEYVKETVKETAHMCKKQNIPFPEVHFPNEDVKKRKDFYVFKGQNAPTVIHMPLFNVRNCRDEVETWRNKYSTCQSSYSIEMITDLMEVAGKNISNNREKLKEEINAVIEQKRSRC